MSGRLRQAARRLASSTVAAAQPFRWAVQVKTTTNRETTGLVEVERVGTGVGFWAQVRNSVYLAAGDLVWVVKDPSAQGNWIFDGFVTGAGAGESLNGSPIPSVQTPVVTSPDGTPLIIRPIARQQGTIGRAGETINFAGAINVAEGITFAALGAGIVQSSAGGVLSSDYTIDDTTTWATGKHILPTDAAGQDLGDATHRWDLFGAVADISVENAAAGGGNSLQAFIYQTDGTGMTGTLRGAYITASGGNTANTGTIRGIEIKGRAGRPGETGNDVAVLEGFSVSSDAKTYDVTVHRGGEIILDGGAGTSTLAVGLRIANNFQANRATTSYGLQIYYDSFVYTADIQLSDGSTIMDYAQGFGINFTTAIAQAGMIGINNTRFLHTYGTNNLFIGRDAGNFTLTQTRNIGIGALVLDALTDGEDNLGIGHTALTANQSGDNNVALGSFALAANVSGTGNMGIGTNALTSNIVGVRNVAVGVGALAANDGDSNVGIGNQAGFAITSGDNNLAIGAYALLNHTTGNANVGVGTNVLNKNTTAFGNVGVGTNAGYWNQAGERNVFIGHNAGQGTGNHNKSRNVMIGNHAGQLTSTADNNILIGYQAGDVLTTGDNNIIIGYDIDPSAADASNEINIGGVYFGDTSTGVAWLKNKLIFTQADGDEYIDSLADGYMDYRATTAHRFGDGTNQLLISGAGVVMLEGTAKRWLAVRPDLDFTTITAQGKPTQVVIGVFHGYSMPIYNNDNEEMFFNLNVPGRWDEASDIIVHLLVALSGAEDVNDNFNFQLSWEHLTEGDVVPATSHDVEVEQAVLAARNAQHSTYELQFTLDYDVDDPDDVADHDDLSVRLRRIDATNPDVTNEIIVLDYHVEFQVNKMFDAEAA